MSEVELKVEAFPVSYRAKMIAAYPVIADMTKDEAYFATAAEMDEAFARILACRNLRITHGLFLAGAGVGFPPNPEGQATK